QEAAAGERRLPLGEPSAGTAQGRRVRAGGAEKEVDERQAALRAVPGGAGAELAQVHRRRSQAGPACARPGGGAAPAAAGRSLCVVSTAGAEAAAGWVRDDARLRRVRHGLRADGEGGERKGRQPDRLVLGGAGRGKGADGGVDQGAEKVSAGGATSASRR